MRNSRRMFTLAISLFAFFGGFIGTYAAEPANVVGSNPKGPAGDFQLVVPDHPLDLILARPENNSITVSAMTYQDAEGSVEYGSRAGALLKESPIQHLKKGVPSEFRIDGLEPDSSYWYRFRTNSAAAARFEETPEYSFHTARAAGHPFSFTLTADAHLDEHTSPKVYEQTLAGIQKNHPDFHIDLGNLFMTDKHPTRIEAANQYLAERYYLGLIGPSVPIFLALGTHDGEASRYDDGSATCVFAWSNLIRKQFFPNPIPDDFYSGSDKPAPHVGLRQNYYAWEWGDALFVVLDPFGYCNNSRGRHDGWDWSLGLEQYHWLKTTLEHSHAKCKFVFIHNLLRGDQASRGGVEFAAFNEWGGRNPDGSDGFKDHRPSWELPIHPLLLQNHVTAVFRAHDNFYARQELDGMAYIMVPQPSFAGDDRIRDLDSYGYKSGTFLGNSGYVRVSVGGDQIKIEYDKTTPDRTRSATQVSSPAADAYLVKFH